MGVVCGRDAWFYTEILTLCLHFLKTAHSLQFSPHILVKEIKLLLISHCDTQLIVRKAFQQLSPENTVYYLAAVRFVEITTRMARLEETTAAKLPRLYFTARYHGLKLKRLLYSPAGGKIGDVLLRFLILLFPLSRLQILSIWDCRNQLPPSSGSLLQYFFWREICHLPFLQT